MAQAKAVIKKLEAKFGCTECRVQEVDLTENPTAAFIKAISI